jgi:hypothetical protein
MSELKYRIQPGTHTVEMFKPEGEQQMLIPELIIPKGKPFTRFINGDMRDFRPENMEWTAELDNSDAVKYHEQIQEVLRVAAQVDDDKVRTGLLEIILWMEKGAPFKCSWYPIQENPEG